MKVVVESQRAFSRQLEVEEREKKRNGREKARGGTPGPLTRIMGVSRVSQST